MTHIITNMKQVSEIMWQILPHLLNSFVRSNMIYKEFFNLIKSYINHGCNDPQFPNFLSEFFKTGFLVLQNQDQVVNGSVYLI